MKNKNKKINSCIKDRYLPKESVIKKSDNYCIINGEKIEGNACSTILDTK